MFYLFFPLICLLFKKPSHFTLVMLVIILLGPLARTIFSDNEIWQDHSYFSCMDGIAIGCLAAIFSNNIKLNKKMFLLTLFSGVFLFTFIFIFRKQAYDLGISKIGLNVTLLEICIALILIAMQEWYTKGKRHGTVWTAAIRWFGRNSYEIYLTHMFFIAAAMEILFNDKQSISLIVIWYLLVITMSGIFGQLISLYFSSPMNRMIRERKKTALLTT